MTTRLPAIFSVVCLSILLGACAGGPAPASRRPGYSGALPGRGPQVRSSSYILVDAGTGATLAASNAHTPRQVASTQKLLMALVVLDQGNLAKRVLIQPSDKAVGRGGVTVSAFRAGDTATRHQLLTASLVKSANDMVQALARDVGGTEARFMQMMNAKARQLGMRSSYFANPHGMPASGQHSTAADMAICARAAYHSGFIRRAAAMRNYTFRTGSGRTIALKATNHLLEKMSACNGLKTGYTDAAGPCLISSAARNGRGVILVQLHSQSGNARWDDARNALEWGLRRVSGR